MMEASNSPVPQTLPLIAGTLMNLRLSNPTDLSYLHSVIHLMLYVLPLMPTALQPAGMLLTALKALDKHQGKPVKILDMLLWRIILREWQNIHMQQDCAELFKHVMDRCRILALMSSWEARVLTDTPVGQKSATHDRGTIISLAIPSAAATLQDCVDEWHNQPYVHAMTSCPLLLILVLARYSDLDRGRN